MPMFSDEPDATDQILQAFDLLPLEIRMRATADTLIEAAETCGSPNPNYHPWNPHELHAWADNHEDNNA